MSLIDDAELEEADAPLDLQVMGRIIGTSSGWDSLDTSTLAFYDFVPAEGVDLPEAPVLAALFETGRFETYDEEGNIVWFADIVTVLKDVPIHDPET